MAPEIPAEQMVIYQAAAKRRQAEKKQKEALHYQRAWKVVQRASHLLKEQFGVQAAIRL